MLACRWLALVLVPVLALVSTAESPAVVVAPAVRPLALVMGSVMGSASALVG